MGHEGYVKAKNGYDVSFGADSSFLAYMASAAHRPRPSSLQKLITQNPQLHLQVHIPSLPLKPFWRHPVAVWIGQFVAINFILKNQLQLRN